jgi:hypothetical protein
MKSFLSSMAAIALTAGAVLAVPNKGTSVSHSPTSGGYHLTHGKQFSGGYYYPGRDHHHWSYWGYSSRYRCTCYWCPDTRCYYYWCPSASCYYPVSYFESAPPVETAPIAPLPVAKPVIAPPVVPAPTPAPVQFQTQIQTQTQTQVIRPSGVPPLP